MKSEPLGASANYPELQSREVTDAAERVAARQRP